MAISHGGALHYFFFQAIAFYASKNCLIVVNSIENLKHNEMLDPLGQAWQNGSASAA